MVEKDGFPHQNIEWDPNTESYKIVENPSWDIEKKFQTYLELTEMGMDEKASSEIVKQFSMVKPVYACYCPGSAQGSTSIASPLEEHTDLKFAFMPCPCVYCEEKAKNETDLGFALCKTKGFDILKPLASISLDEKVVKQMILSMRTVCQTVLAESALDDSPASWFSTQLLSSTDEFELFIKMLIRYGETSHCTWCDIVDETWRDIVSEFEDSASIKPYFFGNLAEFENQWISYHLHMTYNI